MTVRVTILAAAIALSGLAVAPAFAGSPASNFDCAKLDHNGNCAAVVDEVSAKPNKSPGKTRPSTVTIYGSLAEMLPGYKGKSDGK